MAYRFKDSETHSVFWIHTSSQSRVNKTCLEIAKSAKIPGWDDPKTNKLELVSEWLESPRSGRWILMVDNADDFDLLFGSGNLAKSLPKSSTGSILMSTRDARVGMEFTKRTTILLGAQLKHTSWPSKGNRRPWAQTMHRLSPAWQLLA